MSFKSILMAAEKTLEVVIEVEVVPLKIIGQRITGSTSDRAMLVGRVAWLMVQSEQSQEMCPWSRDSEMTIWRE